MGVDWARAVVLCFAFLILCFPLGHVILMAFRKSRKPSQSLAKDVIAWRGYLAPAMPVSATIKILPSLAILYPFNVANLTNK